MVSVTALSKSYGPHFIFDDIAFTLMTGEKVGLVGRNGSGKTTLLRLLMGEEEPDSGTITVPRNYRMGHLSQQVAFNTETVLKEACLGLSEDDNGSDRTYQAEAILLGLGFLPRDFSRPPQQLSGGFQIRLNLAKLLLSEPDLLLLDEPTNYLDIVSIRWLTRFLRSWKREIIIITHDRWFMDRITTHTMGIYRAKVRKVEGSTQKFYQQILDEEELSEKTRLREERQKKEIELFISRFRAQARRASIVQSRIKALEKRTESKKLPAERTMDFQFPFAPIAGKWLVEVSDLNFSYTAGAPIIDNLSFAIGKHDRIGVIGKNGKGKTTLLSLIAGRLSPSGGEIRYHQNVSTGYFGQPEIEKLNPGNTIEEEISLVRADTDRRKVRGICGAMLFEGDKACKKIDVLSGGEKSRVLLGRLLSMPSNLLLLDEPTNHLDQEAVDSLIEAIETFEGAAVIATHSEMVLEATANRLIVFEEGKAFLFEGSYRDFLDRIGWQDEEAPGRQAGKNQAERKQRTERKDLRRLRAGIITERSRLLSPLESRISQLENVIIGLEERVRDDNESLLRASRMGEGKAIAALSISLHESKKRIESLFEELEEISGRHSTLARDFEKQLLQLENETGIGDDAINMRPANESRR
jgi:ATP-binding cassette subfamily F protein 3